MKKQYLLAAMAAVMAVSATSCGIIDEINETEADSSAGESVASQAEQESQTVGEESSQAQQNQGEEGTPAVADESSQADDSQDGEVIPVSGIFTETVDGVEENYVIIGENESYLIGMGEVTGVPVEIEQTADTILINRGGVDDSDPVEYTYDGNVLTFERNGSAYEWTKIEFIPISGTYYEVDAEGTYLNEWVFNGDGTGTVAPYGSDESVNMTYTQTADGFEVSTDGGEAVSYSYTFDVMTLTLTADDGSVTTLKAANS